MEDLKDKEQIEMTEREVKEFMPKNGGFNEMNAELINKNIENSVDVSENILSGSKEDSVQDINLTGRSDKIEKSNKSDDASEGSSGSDGSEILITIPDKIKKKLPGDFNFNDIGSIDLKEAEAIANEDILFLTEDDLIEGLEDFDLIPLKDDLAEKEDQKPVYKKETLQKTPEKVKREPLPDIKIKIAKDEEPSRQKVDELITDTKEIIIEDAGKTALDNEDGKPEIPGSITDTNIAVEEESGASMKTEDNTGEMKSPEKNIPPDSITTEDSLVGKISSWDDKRIETDKSDPFVLKKGDDTYDETGFEKETLPDDLKEIAASKDNILFIDDLLDDSGGKSKKLFDENELEKATSDIVEITSRNVRILTETGIGKALDSHRFISLVKDSSTAQQDLQIDFIDYEYKYRDSELEFVDGAIFEEDYSKYIREIDDFYVWDREKRVSAAVEIFGIDGDEDEIIHDRLFTEEYKNIDLDKEVDLFKSDFGIIDLSITKERFFNYLLPSDDSLSDYERLSIEEDISSKGAIIFEEDIDEIKRLYGRDVSDAVGDEEKLIDEINDDDSFKSEFGIEIEIDGKEKKEEIPGPETVIQDDFPAFEDHEPVPAIHEEAEEVIQDITDNIVILEDDLDIDRFVKEFPEKKAADLKGLLKYLDGLFEKLPESTVRSFANSEYFDLYVKILSDMGI